MTILAPKDEGELKWMMKFAPTVQGPVAIRYPRGAGIGVDQTRLREPIFMGRAEICREGKDVAILALGNMLHPALKAAQLLSGKNIDAMVVNPRFIKPIDRNLLESLFRRRIPIVTIETGVLQGGFGSFVLETAADAGYQPQVLRMGIPDSFVPQGAPAEIQNLFDLNSDGIVKNISQWISQRSVAKAVY